MSGRVEPSRVEHLFMEAVDGRLDLAGSAELEAALAEDPKARARFEAYRATVGLLRASVPEKAPAALASVVLRRTRRRRLSSRRAEHALAERFPAEVVIPLLLAAVVAFLMVLGSS